jgi:SdrD B-like domain
MLLSTLIQLNSSGSGFSTGTLTNPATADAYDFRATVSGRISVLMHAEQQGMQSQLTGASGTTFTNQTFVASQVVGAQDHLVQLDHVVAGQDIHLLAGVIYDPTQPLLPYAVGPYQLYISTETTDFSATTPHILSLDSSGQGLQLGTIETPGDADLFAFTASVTGRAFVRVDGGAVSGQELHIDTISGQTYGILVSDAGNHAGPYVLTIDSIADDFPDATVFDIDFSKTSTLSGTINYADDVDNFRFTATQSGVMTLKMQNQPGPDDVSTLRCALSVSGATVSYDISPPRLPTREALANDRIVQFEVIKGHQYTFRASGANGSVGSYLLSLSLAVDDFSATTPHVISLDSSTGAGTQTGSIEVPGDKDLFQFTATADGYVVVALMPAGSSSVEPGTNMQGLLTFPDPGVIVPVGVGAISLPAGWLATTRDQFAALQVTKGASYEFFVSADNNTIGDYTLTLATYTSGARATFTTTSAGFGPPGEGSVTFDFSTAGPSVKVEVTPPGPAVSPVSEVAASPTNTRLAAFSLPSSNTAMPPATVTVPTSGLSTGSTSNSLIATLLFVAARDNSVQSTDSAGALGSSNAASTLLTSLLVGIIAPGSGGTGPIASGGSDSLTDPVISGTVFDDLDGDGWQDSDEPGVAGETVLLEVQKDGEYVVVHTATTDVMGAYGFADVKPGDYRVRRVNQAGPGPDHTTPTSYPVKVIGDTKPMTFNFGMVSKRRTTHDDRRQISDCWVVDAVVPPRENANFEEAGLVFQDWDEVGGAASLLDNLERDRSANDWWLGLLRR